MLVGLICCTSVAESKRPDAGSAGSEALRPMLACRAIAADAERLACFDRAAKELEDAAAKHDVLVMDSRSITRARRSLFGFGMPSLDIFTGSKADEQIENEISSTVRTAQRDADGNWIITIEDGAVWHQTGGTIGGAVRNGDAIVIRRAALGSYFLRVGNRPGVKARREG